MEIRNWQQKIIDDFPSIVKDNRRFILKAPTGAGKTYLASELIKRFYNKKKVIVLCHRLVLLEQLEKSRLRQRSRCPIPRESAVSGCHRVRQLPIHLQKVRSRLWKFHALQTYPVPVGQRLCSVRRGQLYF